MTPSPKSSQCSVPSSTTDDELAPFRASIDPNQKLPAASTLVYPARPSGVTHAVTPAGFPITIGMNPHDDVTAAKEALKHRLLLIPSAESLRAVPYGVQFARLTCTRLTAKEYDGLFTNLTPEPVRALDKWHVGLVYVTEDPEVRGVNSDGFQTKTNKHGTINSAPYSTPLAYGRRSTLETHEMTVVDLQTGSVCNEIRVTRIMIRGPSPNQKEGAPKITRRLFHYHLACQHQEPSFQASLDAWKTAMSVPILTHSNFSAQEDAVDANCVAMLNAPLPLTLAPSPPPPDLSALLMSLSGNPVSPSRSASPSSTSSTIARPSSPLVNGHEFIRAHQWSPLCLRLILASTGSPLQTSLSYLSQPHLVEAAVNALTSFSAHPYVSLLVEPYAPAGSFELSLALNSDGSWSIGSLPPPYSSFFSSFGPLSTEELIDEVSRAIPLAAVWRAAWTTHDPSLPSDVTTAAADGCPLPYVISWRVAGSGDSDDDAGTWTTLAPVADPTLSWAAGPQATRTHTLTIPANVDVEIQMGLASSRVPIHVNRVDFDTSAGLCSLQSDSNSQHGWVTEIDPTPDTYYPVHNLSSMPACPSGTTSWHKLIFSSSPCSWDLFTSPDSNSISLDQLPESYQFFNLQILRL